MNENLELKRREEKIVKFFKSRISWIYYLILGIIIWINIRIRSLPIPGLKDISTGGYTLGPDLDPFLFLRYAENIVANGKLFTIDMLRYVPLGYDTSRETQLLPYMIAYVHKIINWFGDYSVEYAAIVMPVFASVFTAIFFFLLVRKIFESKGKNVSNIIAIVSTLLMVLLPSLLSRTIAGIPEKESAGFGLMFLALYLFVAAWKAKKLRNALIIGIASGIATALMALVWGGVIFLYSSIAIASFIALILKKIELKETIVYGSWIIASMLFWIPLTSRMTLKGFVMSSTSGVALIVFGIILTYFVLFKTKLKDHKYLRNEKIRKIPEPILAIIVALILGIILAVVFLGPLFMFDMVQDIFSKLASPYSDRLSFTVAENRQPYFSEWKGSMGPLFQGLPVFFWLFFIGSIYLFAEMIKKLKRNEKFILSFSYVYFLIALIFSRNSPSSPHMNGESLESWIFYISGYIILLIGVGYVFYKRYKENELGDLKMIKFEYLFLFSMSFIGIIAARSAIRLIMALTPIATIIIGYFTVETSRRAIENKKEGKNILLWVIAIIVALGFIFTINTYYRGSLGFATNNVPQAQTHQWQNAMSWVRENTAEDAVFGHWWDYGYWVQSLGKRATMLDGGNAIVYWNYLMGRHGLTAKSEEEAIELLNTHQVTHFLIDPTEIGKYSAYSLIGSDENYDRYSRIGTSVMDDRQTQERKNQTIYVYPGGVAVDEDIVIEEDGREVLIPAQAASIAGTFVYRNMDGTFEKAEVVISYNNRQYNLPLRYLYTKDVKVDFGKKDNTVDGGVYLFPRINSDGSVNLFGASMYLSPRNLRALWVRLYILEEGDKFKLVHSEPSPIHKQYLIPNNMSVGDLVYFQGTQGPIKIWEIQYDGTEKVNEEYLLTDYPEHLEGRRQR